jgi:choline dehydrogenase
MLSGVGDAAQLKKLGIAPAANLRGVGKNLQDHVLVSGVVYSYKGKVVEVPQTAMASRLRSICRAESMTIRSISP